MDESGRRVLGGPPWSLSSFSVRELASVVGAAPHGDLALAVMWDKILWLCPEEIDEVTHAAPDAAGDAGVYCIDPNWALERTVGHLIGLAVCDPTAFGANKAASSESQNERLCEAVMSGLSPKRLVERVPPEAKVQARVSRKKAKGPVSGAFSK